MNNDINEVRLSGTINNVLDDNKDYIKFSLKTKFNNKNVYSSLNIRRDLYNESKGLFIKNKKVLIKGYINSYVNKDNIVSFITVTNIKEERNKIDYDTDGIMLWNGVRCEIEEPTKDEFEEMKKLLKDYK